MPNPVEREPSGGTGVLRVGGKDVGKAAGNACMAVDPPRQRPPSRLPYHLPGPSSRIGVNARLLIFSGSQRLHAFLAFRVESR
jgi:hypothetical protein